MRTGARRDVRVHRRLLRARLAAGHDLHGPGAVDPWARLLAPRRAAVRIFGEPFRSGFDPPELPAWLVARDFRLERDESAAESGATTAWSRRLARQGSEDDVEPLCAGAPYLARDRAFYRFISSSIPGTPRLALAPGTRSARGCPSRARRSRASP